MKKIPAVFHPIYSQLNLPRNHRFPIEKYQALHDRVLKEHAADFDIHIVDAGIDAESLYQVHDQDYVDRFIAGQLSEKEMKRIGFPWTEQFVNRTLHAVAGTRQATLLAAEHSVAINFTGGYHHAHPDFGSGFCVFNDLAIAATTVIEQHHAQRVLIFDTDVHQGDGTATCCALNNDIFSLSIHCEKNFPARKQQSDLDIGLEKNLNDEEYLAVIEQCLSDAIHGFKPDFIIYDAGVDIHINDDLGLLNITTEGVAKRDTRVFSMAKDMGIPIMAVIGGGYQRDIKALTDVHIQMPKAAAKVFFGN